MSKCCAVSNDTMQYVSINYSIPEREVGRWRVNFKAFFLFMYSICNFQTKQFLLQIWNRHCLGNICTVFYVLIIKNIFTKVKQS